MSEQLERRHQISKTISDAMAEFKDVDWTKESPEISAAEAELNEAMAQYADGATSKAHVRDVYQKWRDLFKVGGLF